MTRDIRTATIYTSWDIHKVGSLANVLVIIGSSCASCAGSTMTPLKAKARTRTIRNRAVIPRCRTSCRPSPLNKMLDSYFGNIWITNVKWGSQSVIPTRTFSPFGRLTFAPGPSPVTSYRAKIDSSLLTVSAILMKVSTMSEIAVTQVNAATSGVISR